MSDLAVGICQTCGTIPTMNHETRKGGFFRPIVRFIERRWGIETLLDVKLKPEVAQFLRALLLRPNPRSGEFPYLGLGTSGSIDDIFVTDGAEFSRGLYHVSPSIMQASVETEHFVSLFRSAYDAGRLEEIVLLGHTHPTGKIQSGGTTYEFLDMDWWLHPSMGEKSEGGPMNGGDLAFYRAFRELLPEIPLEYVGIAANVGGVPKMKIYAIDELLTIRRYSDIDFVPQQTFSL